ncbi:hypothetical protein DID75_05315 [Candidatus Marinamargulisbacteria bacterium SCGC AG-410-N11]|nr:hypothetical protein DID75_05315 [Candidatus Marinamargulisbacteria bacterium SCGC AG-410-N11]
MSKYFKICLKTSLFPILFLFLINCNSSVNIQTDDAKKNWDKKEYTDWEKKEGTLPEGAEVKTITHDSINREYVLYLPVNFDRTKKSPLMLNFHGNGMTAIDQFNSANMKDLADANNFVLVYPKGENTEWNSYVGPDNKSSTDDFGFIESLINKLEESQNIDPNRVYACGYSNGGFMVYALTVFKPNLLAAIASVSGTMMENSIRNDSRPNPTPILSIHGTSDTTVPYNGYEGAYVSIPDVLNFWVDVNQIEQNPQLNTFSSQGNNIEHFKYVNSNNGISIEHYKVINGDHVWLDIIHNNKDTNTLIWDFVSQYNKQSVLNQ